MNDNTHNSKGYIKIFQRLLDWEWYHDTKTFRVFIHILLKANTKSKNWKGLNIKRGEFVTSRAKLALETNLSEREVRTALAHLISTNEIAIKTTNKYTIVSVCNYGKYQGEEISSDQQKDQQATNKKTSKRPTKGQQKNIKNITYNKDLEESENVKEPTDDQQTTSKTTTTLNNIYINTFSNEKVCSPKGEHLLKEKEVVDEKEIESKKVKGKTLVGLARKVFEDYYQAQYENPYYWTAKDGAGMKQLLQKISYSRSHREKPLPIDEESLIEALRQFLSKINKGWIADNFSVSIINSQYNTIISELKNKTKQNNNGRTDPNRQFIDPRDGRPITFEEHIAIKVQSSQPGEDASGGSRIPEEVW